PVDAANRYPRPENRCPQLPRSLWQTSSVWTLTQPCALCLLWALLGSDRVASPPLRGKCHIWEPARSTVKRLVATGRNGKEMGLHEVAQHPQAHCNENPKRSLEWQYISAKKNRIIFQ